MFQAIKSEFSLLFLHGSDRNYWNLILFVNYLIRGKHKQGCRSNFILSFFSSFLNFVWLFEIHFVLYMNASEDDLSSLESSLNTKNIDWQNNFTCFLWNLSFPINVGCGNFFIFLGEVCYFFYCRFMDLRRQWLGSAKTQLTASWLPHDFTVLGCSWSSV